MTVGDGDRLLAELESLLTEQFDMLRSGDLAAAMELTERTDGIVRTLESIAEDAPGGRDGRVERIRQLYLKVCLTLAERKEELAGKLHRMRSGKGALRAYRNGGMR